MKASSAASVSSTMRGGGSTAGSGPGGASTSDEYKEPQLDDVSTKLKLTTLMGTFPSFDGEMREGTRVRVEKDRRRIDAMRAEMERLQGLLAEQIKRRERRNDEVQLRCDRALAVGKRQFDALIVAQRETVHTRLDAIVVRLDKLDVRFDEERARVLKEIDERTAELNALLDEFDAKFEAEKIERLERERLIQVSMDAHEAVVDTKFVAEREAREKVLVELNRMLEENMASRQAAGEQFRAGVKGEIIELRRLLGEEEMTRENEDDDIMRALNQYTSKLQSSLTIINSTDA